MNTHISAETQRSQESDQSLRSIRAVYLVGLEDEDERQLHEFFSHISRVVRARQLSSGKLVSYAVEIGPDDQALLGEIADFLKTNYDFVVFQDSLGPLILSVIRALCEDTGSHLLPVPRCSACGTPDPFLSSGEDQSEDEQLLCTSCSIASLP